MAPRTDKPRLNQLTPISVATDGCDLLLTHLGRIAFALAPSICLTGLPSDGAKVAASSDLGLTLQDLTRFAQDGATDEWGGPAGAISAILSVCEVLYRQAGVEGTFGIGDLEAENLQTDVESALGVVLVAALARYRIECGRDVLPRELGCLGSCSADHVSLLARRGEIARNELGRFSSDSARRWLTARGVPGWTAAVRSGLHVKTGR